MGIREQRKCRYFIILAAFFIAVAYLGKVQARAGEEERRVLFLSSYSYSWPSVPAQIKGLQSSIGQEAALEYVFMDTKSVDDEVSQELFYENISYYLSKAKPYDLLIVGDDAALQFAMDHKATLFANIPIVFEGVEDVERALEAGEDPMVTGIVEQADYKSNIDIALRLNPEATRLVAILDDTITGQGARKQFYRQQDSYPQLAFSEINCSQLSRNEICDRLLQSADDTILLFLIFTEDGNGNRYSIHEGASLVTKYASVPAYRMVHAGVGEGLIGGKVVSHERMGEMAGEMAVKILNGKSPSQIKVVTESPSMYYFDFQAAEHFGMDKRNFPKDSVFINEPERRGIRSSSISYAAASALAILALSLLALGFYKRAHIQKIEKILRQIDPFYSHDALTGIRSRMAFLESMQQKVDRKTPCAIALFDIDHFNKINNELGHSAGDELLKEVAARLSKLEDRLFKCYRIGGDEFAGIIQSSSLEKVEAYAKAVQETSCMPFILEEEEYIVQYSIGIAQYPKDGEEVAELISNAGIAVNQVKNSGKDGFGYFGHL